MIVEAYKCAKVAKLLSTKLKFCQPDMQSIDVALALADGDVGVAVDGLSQEWIGQQLVLGTKASIMSSAAMSWADIPAGL